MLALIKTVKASSAKSENINYNTMEVFANATVYFEFDKSSLTSVNPNFKKCGKRIKRNIN